MIFLCEIEYLFKIWELCEKKSDDETLRETEEYGAAQK